jgi:phosphoglycerol transferase
MDARGPGVRRRSVDKPLDKKSCAGELALYVAAVALCVLALVWALKLRRADLEVPLVYSEDSLLALTWIKGVAEHGWYLFNDSIGAPGGACMHDFPMADNLHFLMIKLIVSVYPSAPFAYNLYFLLGFPLATAAALFVCRHFGLARAPALLAAVLYAFLPYHFFQGLGGEVCLASYYLVPLLVLVLLWLQQGQNLFGAPAAGAGRKRLASVVICLLVASAGVYYAFFGCYLLLVAGASAAGGRRKQALASAALYAAVLAAGVGANLLPTFLYQFGEGVNPKAVVRHWIAADWFGLKVVEMLLPLRGHRWPLFADWRTEYDHAPLRLGQNDAHDCLGLAASVGFLLLTARLACRPRGRPGWRLLDGLSVLSIFAVLLATTGGLGALFSFCVSPWIRVYSRIVVYIAFFSLFALAFFLDRVPRAFAGSLPRRAAWAAALGLAGWVGVLDQVRPRFIPDYPWLKEQFETDADMARRIEAQLPAGALVFQLPYVPFPESGPLKQMKDYALFRAYLHSGRLRWSYGAMRGREGDRWLKEVAELPAEEMVRDVTRAGFRGIYINRDGYADHAAALEMSLYGVVGTPPLVSRDGKVSFFQLTGSAKSTAGGLGSSPGGLR